MKKFLLGVFAAVLVLSVSCTPSSKGAYKYVAIIGVDGAGAWFSEDVAPVSYRIGQEGASSYGTQTCSPTISAQCWGTMLLGVLPEVHRLTNEIISGRPYDPESSNPSIFRLMRNAHPDACMASFCGWNPINIGIIEDNIGVMKGTGSFPEIEDKAVRYPRIDEAVAGQAAKFVEDNDNPSLLFVQLNYVDAAGHWNGYGSPAHLESITFSDGLIRSIYEAYDKKGILDDTLFIITADHGGTPDGKHGGESPEEKTVFLGIHGRTIAPGSGMADAEVQDIPVIAAYALGLDIPENWTGKIPAGLFPEIK